MIDRLRSKIPVRFLCRYFSVSPSSYYHWKKGVLPPRMHLKISICDEINRIFKDSKETYGSPRVHQELKFKGIIISENTVAKYMNELARRLQSDARR